MWKSSCSLAAALVVALWLGCGRPRDGGPAVARVGDAVLTRADLESQIPDGEVAAAGQRRQAVEDWVRQELLYQEAHAQHLDDDPRVRKILEQAGRDLVVAAFLDQTFEDRQLEVSPAEVERHYNTHASEFRRTDAEIRAQHILLGSRRDATALRQELLQGVRFEAKARELSLDRATTASGGDLGYFTADEQPELWAACANLEPGELSQIVATEQGFHILLLVDHQDPGSLRSLDETVVREGILETLVREKHRARLDTLLDQLKTKHDWQIDETQLVQP